MKENYAASAATFAFTFVLAGSPTNQVTPPKPNVLFIICDDLNDCVERLGGNPDAKTPNISRLMDRGVSFLNAQCNAPLCSPSRPSMLTGLYPHTARFFGDAGKDTSATDWYVNPVYTNAKTWVQFFKENQYSLFGTGKIYSQQQEKWSDFYDTNGVLQYGQKQAFDPLATDGVGYPNKVSSIVYPQQNWRDKYGFFACLDQPPALNTNTYPHAGWMVNGKRMKYISDDDRDLTPDEISANYVTNLLHQTHSKPFFINMGLHRPHLPLTAPRRNFDRFPAHQIHLADIKEDDLDDCARTLIYGYPEHAGDKLGGFGKYDGVVAHNLLAEFTQAYLACVNFADEQIGQVLDALDASPYATNTIVIVTGDNGFHLGEKHYLFKQTAWEESTHVPLVIAGPGIAKGKTVKHPVSLVDIYPTLLDLARLPPDPNGPSLPLDGHSLRSLLEHPDNETWNGPDVALTSLANRDTKNDVTLPENQDIVNRQSYTVRSVDFRYTLCPNGEEELYDHRVDPNEWTNQAGNSAFSEIKATLRAEMEQLVGEPLGHSY